MNRELLVVEFKKYRHRYLQIFFCLEYFEHLDSKLRSAVKRGTSGCWIEDHDQFPPSRASYDGYSRTRLKAYFQISRLQMFNV